MSIFKFEPSKDITTYELAVILKTFLLAIHQEAPNKNLEVMSSMVNFLKSVDPEMARHFIEVSGYD